MRRDDDITIDDAYRTDDRWVGFWDKATFYITIAVCLLVCAWILHWVATQTARDPGAQQNAPAEHTSTTRKVGP